MNSKSIVATRSLQLTQKANTQQCKTLESAIKTYNANDEKVSQSYRCIDIDREIPELMGVSKAVLESVIFCHQEDSNWPLDDPSTLKKKFDDIFASSRYTKALEVMKKQQKEQNQSIRELRLQLQTAQLQMDSANRIKADIESAKDKILKGNGRIEQHDKDINELEAKIATKKKGLEEVNRAVR